MKISVITLFPNLYLPFLETSILGRAAKKRLANYQIVDLRQFGEGPHLTVDDSPYGGGAGMVIKAPVLKKAWESIATKNSHTILMSAGGALFKEDTAKAYSKLDHLIIISGHYEGVDQRFVDKYVNQEISIGDFVLTGGELPSLVVIDATIRLIGGVLKKAEATTQESFNEIKDFAGHPLLEYPHYTRPEVFGKAAVPTILLSGNHAKIRQWRQEQALDKTKKLRPDLLK